MKRVEGFGNLQSNAADCFQRNFTRLAQVLERHPTHVGEDERDLPFELEKVDRLDDEGVFESKPDPGLVNQQLPKLTIASVRLFDDDEAAIWRTGKDNRAHPAGAKIGDDLILPDELSAHSSGPSTGAAGCASSSQPLRLRQASSHSTSLRPRKTLQKPRGPKCANGKMRSPPWHMDAGGRQGGFGEGHLRCT